MNNGANGTSKPSYEQLVAVINTLQADNAALKAKNTTIRYKVSDKGALSVYGLHARFPVTLYAAQWERLLEKADEIREFIRRNDSDLTRKA